MATTRTLTYVWHRNSSLLIQRCLSASAKSGSSGSPPASPPPASPVSSANVPGLSKNVLSVPSEPVGPGAAKDKAYKNPEYFCYNTMSFFEAEVEMAKYRLPQPSNKTPLK